MSTSNPSANATPWRIAVRFPLHLELTVHSGEGVTHAVTENVSANGILFIADAPPPVDARVEFKITMPAKIMGSAEDVTLHCIGRIVRHELTDGKNMAAAIIDEYSLKAEHQ